MYFENSVKKYRHIYAIAAICFATFALYWPGLTSGFYLDDTPNLKALSGINNIDQLLNFLFNNETHRVLSYLSFVPQQNAWSSNNPFPIKLFNLFIHLINSCLVYYLALIISKSKSINNSNAVIISTITALLWSLSPININTVLYAIQRMTLLSGMCVLLASIYFLTRVSDKQNLSYWLKSAIIILFLYVIGILFKENAILIGVHLLVILFTIKNGHPIPRWWTTAILIIPITSTVIYILLSNKLSYNGRDFTLIQRLLTEPIILFDYLRKILFSLPQDISIFYDDYAYIQSISSKPSILFYIFFIIASISLSIFFRKKYPIAAFCTLWFFGGHLLESTIIPLELYFEHRNYIPAIGVYFGIAFLLITHKQYRVILLPLLTVILINAFITSHLEINSWRNKEQFAKDAIIDHPLSTRAIQVASEHYLSVGDIHKSSYLVKHAHANIKPYSSHLLYLILMKCLDPRIEIDAWPTIKNEIDILPYDRYLEKSTHDLFTVLQQGECQYLSWANYNELLQLLSAKAPKQKINYYLMHIVFMHQRKQDTTTALNTVRMMNINNGTIDQGFFKVAMLLEYEQNTEAKQAFTQLKARFENTKAGLLNWQQMKHFEVYIGHNI
jgi:hypothetical protein